MPRSALRAPRPFPAHQLPYLPVNQREFGCRAAGRTPGSPVGVGSAHDADDSHAMMLLVDPVDHAVGATSGAVSILERRTKPLPTPVWVVEQWADDEVVRREGHR